MQAALRMTTRVLPGSRVEVVAPELREGESVEVRLVVNRSSESPSRSMFELTDSLPPGPRSAASWEEIERSFQEERKEWEQWACRQEACCTSMRS